MEYLPLVSLIVTLVMWNVLRKYNIKKDDSARVERTILGVRQDLIKEHERLEESYDSLEGRLRKLEAGQVTESQVRAIMEDRMKPLEDNMSELKQHYSKMADIMMDVARDLSLIKGKLDSRRKDD